MERTVMVACLRVAITCPTRHIPLLNTRLFYHNFLEKLTLAGRADTSGDQQAIQKAVSEYDRARVNTRTLAAYRPKVFAGFSGVEIGGVPCRSHLLLVLSSTAFLLSTTTPTSITASTGIPFNSLLMPFHLYCM